MAKSLTQEFTKGLWAEIPPFRLVLGLCPTLAVSNTFENGIGMGIAVTFVLVFSNILISALRKIIPAKVRIAAFIIVIATFVTVVELLMQAYTYALFLQLGIFIPLIVVNCILLGRAEAFASKNGIIRSTLSALEWASGTPWPWGLWRPSDRSWERGPSRSIKPRSSYSAPPSNLSRLWCRRLGRSYAWG